jgi:uncharacterized protein YjaG (DUF416 family)
LRIDIFSETSSIIGGDDMSLCKSYNYVSSAAYDAMYKLKSKCMKLNTLKNIDNQLEKLDKKFSLEEKYLQHFKIFDTHLSAVAACQETAHIMRSQLSKQIEEMES